MSKELIDIICISFILLCVGIWWLMIATLTPSPVMVEFDEELYCPYCLEKVHIDIPEEAYGPDYYLGENQTCAHCGNHYWVTIKSNW